MLSITARLISGHTLDEQPLKDAILAVGGILYIEYPDRTEEFLTKRIEDKLTLKQRTIRKTDATD